MRPVTVRRCDRLEHDQLAGAEALVQESQGRMQPEGVVQPPGSIRAAGRRNRQIAMQARIIRVCIGGHGGQAVERAAQNHHNEPRGSAGVREQHLRAGGGSGQRSGAN
jgi:hypothetical protein